MKRNHFAILIYTLGIVGLIITLFIIYMDSDNSFATKFVVGYVIFLFLFLFYFVIATILNLGNIEWAEIKNRLFKFILSFILISCVSFIYNYIKNPSQIDVNKLLFTPLAVSIGSAFSDLPYIRKNKN
ncbi:hypothetical protein [Neobacillus drentensis]|uniref:hypothetical protein n=1 Tax=Neobacillus drentensis TaxID=220684 RepID=UPI0028567884|nr:hypothetical protein [Neobacillus drentensis]MDR7240576.1 putative membrane protein YqjE [Neobacillus drentensis]